MRVRERLPLCTPVAEKGDIVLPLRNSSSTMHIGDPVITADVRASALAKIDPHTLCFCYCDLPGMELGQTQMLQTNNSLAVCTCLTFHQQSVCIL